MQECLKRGNVFELHIEDADEILMLDFIKISTDRDYYNYINSFSFNCHYLNESYEVKHALKYDNLIKSYNSYIKKKDIVSNGELYEIDSNTGKITKILELKNIVLSSINEYEQYVDLYCDWCIATGNYSNNIGIIDYQPIDYQPTFRPKTIDDDYDDSMMLTNNIDEYDEDEEYDDKTDKFDQSYKSILSRIKTLF